MSVDLRGSVALVTGGGTGLGRAISLALARAGADVAIGYSVSTDDAEATEAELRALGIRSSALQGDLRSWKTARLIVEEVQRRHGSLDILVNNAGVTRSIPFDDLDAVEEGDWDSILEINLRAAFAFVQAAAPGMRRRGYGRVLNVASNSAFTADGSSIPYVVSKGALITLTHALARALAPTILVNAVAPGWMETRWMERHLAPAGRRRLAVAPVDVVAVADIALALIGNDAITGEVLVVDRGEHLHPGTLS